LELASGRPSTGSVAERFAVGRDARTAFGGVVEPSVFFVACCFAVTRLRAAIPEFALRVVA
jgi:hypothetical protein